jgi:hypothetical protein
LEEAVARFKWLGSGQIGWYDNMLLVSANEVGFINAVHYAQYWRKKMRAAMALAPEVRPDGGTYAQPVEVAIRSDTPGATIHYTLDGSEPTEDSPVYVGPMTIGKSAVLQTRAVKPGLESQPPTLAKFTIEPLDFSRAGLAAWFRADRGVVAEGGSVLRWLDQSGHGHHGQAVTAESAPRFIPADSGGLPAVAGGDQARLRLARILPLAGDCTIAFVVAFPRGYSGGLIGDGDDGAIDMRDLPPGRLGVRFNVGIDGVRIQADPPLSPRKWAVWSVVRRGDFVEVSQNGRRFPAQKLAAVTPMNLQFLLATRGYRNSFRGELTELMIFDRALGRGQLVEVHAWLAARANRLGPAVTR